MSLLRVTYFTDGKGASINCVTRIRAIFGPGASHLFERSRSRKMPPPPGCVTHFKKIFFCTVFSLLLFGAANKID
jgi:hypothetical protein